MMKKFLRLGGAYMALSVFIAMVTSSVAWAAGATTSSGAGNGYKIAPVRTDLVINPGSTQTTTVFVQNVSSVVETLQIIINDFQANPNESGAPALFLNDETSQAHGLKQFITIANPTFDLQPGQQKGIDVKIAVPTSAAAGGYYGAVRVAPANASGNKNVNLAASVASLILIKVPGDITEQMSVASLQVASSSGPHTFFTKGKGLQAVVRLHNSGNVQEEPFGKVQLKKGKKLIGTYDINNTDPRGNVLPDSTRKFTVGLADLNSLGGYSLQGNFGYGSNGQLLNATTTFYVVPVTAIILIVVIVVALVLIVFGLPRLIHSYNRRVLRRAGRR